MARFVIGQPITTTVPIIDVDPGLPVGSHRFRLIVLDDSGNRSAPDEVDVIVADQTAPTAVLRAPSTVAFATSFPLDGRGSVDAGGGQIVRYRWTYLGPNIR